MDWTWGWTAVAAIATWALAGGLGFAFWQMRQARRSTNAQVAVELFKELRKDEVLQILRRIYDQGLENIKNLTNDDKNEITYVLERLGMLGALIDRGIIDEALAIDVYGGATALKCWYLLRDYIREVRDRQGLQWCIYVEDFAARVFEHWSGRRPEEWALYYRDKGEGIGLVEQLKNRPKPLDLVKWLRNNEELRPRRLKEILKESRQVKGES